MANKPAPKKTDSVLETVLKDFKSSWEYTSGSWHKRWQDNFFLYNNQRVKKGYQGITDTFVPMAFGTVETLTSALFGSKPKFQFLPPQERSDQKTDILNSLLDFYWDKDQWSIKVINSGRSMFMLGTGVDYFYWQNDHPCMINVPLRDFFFDPTCTSLEDARFMGRRYLTTKEELESFEIIDLDNPTEIPLLEDGLPTGEFETTYEMKPKYTNLDKVNADGSKGDPTDKEQKDMWYGSTVSEPENNQIEVIEYWTLDKTISIANRSVVIEDAENYYKSKAKANGSKYPKGLMPFAAARDYVDASLFLAKGEIDFILDQQELLNDQTNQRNDAIMYAINQMYTLDPKYAHMINEVENLPGAVYPFEKDALVPIMKGQIPADSFNESLNLKNEIRETTASSEVVRGVKSDQDATATEVNAQIAGAGQRLGLKITQIENEYFHRMARIVLEMIKLYVTEPMMVRILGKDGAKWEEFDPSEFDGDYEPRVQLDIELAAKEREDASMVKEMLAAFLGDPDVNQQELKKLVMQRGFQLDPDEVEALVVDAPVDPMTGLPADPMMEDPMMGGEMMDVAPDPVTGELMPMEEYPEEAML